ncbi:S41 family peptidase [Roseivirga sp.]|uniref:S41 family peptidase n=1 Tax=Roseivirga sp. TaxID=1964215 RepID=UPI003B8E0A3E
MITELKSTINKIVIVSVLALMATVSLFASNSNRTITRQEAVNDLEVYFKIIDQQHGNPYQYISREAFQQFVNDKIEALPAAISLKQFEVVLSELNNQLLCGHTVVKMESKLLKSTISQTQFFPLPIKIIEGNIFVDFEQSDIPHGAQLMTINGVNTDNLISELIKITVTDGFSSTKPLREIESKFGYYFFLKHGASDMFEVSYQAPNGEQKDIQIQAVSGNNMLANNYYRPINLSHERYNRFTHLDAIDSLQTLILTLNTFQANPDWFHEKVTSRYNEDDKEFDFENLIIDLRINEGGDRRLLNILYQFLTGDKLNDPSATYTRSQNILMEEYVSSINGRLKSDEAFEHANNYLQKYFKTESEDHFEAPVLNWYDEFEGGEAKDWEGSRFDGKIYVLISGKTFSAAADLARILGQMDNVVLIGEETGGAHVGRAANMIVKYSLPNTQTMLQVPVIYEEFLNVTEGNKGRGTFPDYLIQPNLTDLLSKKDIVLNHALNLISIDNPYGSN